MVQKQTIYIISFTFLLLSFALLGSVPNKNVITREDTQINNNTNPAVIVEMTNTMKFTPDTVRIKAGKTVRWKNTSLLVHSVTGDPSQSTIEGSVELPKSAKPFNSGMMDPKQTFTHAFKLSGTYQYFCIPHEGAKMYGWVIVSDT